MSAEIHLNLGARFTAKPAFSEWNDNIKGAQRSCKDFADAGRGVLSNLAGAFEGELCGAITSTVDVLQEIVKGGIWGALGAVANVAVGAVVKKFTEAREHAKKLEQEFADAAKKIGTAVQSIGSEGASALSRISEDANRAAQSVGAVRDEYYAMQELAKQKSIAAGGTGEEVDSATRIMKRQWAVQDAEIHIETAKKRLAEAEATERRVLRATVNARSARWRRGGENVDIKKAESALADAKRSTDAARAELGNAEARKRAALALADADYYRAQNEQAEKKRKSEEAAAEEEERAAEEALEAERKRKDEEVRAAEKAEREKTALAAKREKEERTAAEKAKRTAQDRAKEEIKSLDKVAAEQKRLAGEWESVSQTMRGKSFRDWLAEDSKKDDASGKFRKANAEAARRARRIRRDARHGWAGAREQDWLAKYDRWNAAQDPANNKFAKSVEEIEAKKVQAVESMDKTLASIDAKLTQALTVE